jgi:hypothetical protein
MTEADWLACDHPGEMLMFLRRRANERKRRLFAVACCRGVEDMLRDEARVCEVCGQAIEVAQRMADGQASAEEQGRVHQAADWQAQALHSVFLCGGVNVPGSNYAALTAAAAVAPTLQLVYTHSGPQMRQTFSPWECAARAHAQKARETILFNSRLSDEYEQNPSDEWWQKWEEAATEAWFLAYGEARRGQCALLRDLFHPFRRGKIARSFLTWNDGIIAKIARGIYDEHAFERMGILGDALEEAGCTDEALLGHLRAGGYHVRGCWALDLVLAGSLPAARRRGTEKGEK